MWMIDFFAAPCHGEDSDALYKARLLAGILLSYLLIIAGFVCYLVVGAQLPFSEVSAGVVLMVPLALVFVAGLIVLRQRGHFAAIAQAAIAATYLGIMAGVYVSGGPIETPAAMIIIMPCVLAFCLLGLRAGLLWTVIVFATNIAGIGLALAGFHYPQVAPPDMHQTNRIFNWVVAFFSIVAVVIVYENINARLKHERDAERDRYKHMATHDALTGLANRKLFHESLRMGLERAQRNSYHVALLMIDLNGFKPINDMLGHEAGDKALQHVANHLRAAIRRTDTAARLGGDEFAVILEGLSGEQELGPVLEKIENSIATPIEDVAGKPIVTASIGIALYPSQTGDTGELLRLADVAMYHAKRNRLGHKLYDGSPAAAA
jgi:diguanylate cyclase (GGDEF)-like protein